MTSAGRHEIWELVRKHPEGVGIDAVVNRLKAPRWKVLRKLSELKKQGYVLSSERGVYKPNLKVEAMAPMKMWGRNGRKGKK